MKKKILALSMCIALAAIAIVGASLAYFTDTKTAKNTFTMGNVQIKLDEANIKNPEGDRVTSNEYNVYPGLVVDKDPTVHNTGKNGAWVRAIVTIENGMNWLGLYNDNVWTAPQVEAHMEALMPAPLPAIVIEESEPPVESEICRATVNYTDVAPFGEPVTGGEN